MTLDTSDERSDFWGDVIKSSLWRMEVYALAARASEVAPLQEWSSLGGDLFFLEEESRDYILPSSLDARLLAALQRQVDALVRTRVAEQVPPPELVDEWITTTNIVMALSGIDDGWDELRLHHRYTPELFAKQLAAISVSPDEIAPAFTWPLEHYLFEPGPPTEEEKQSAREELALIRAGKRPVVEEWV